MKRSCIVCSKFIIGRSDKIYCSTHCKSYYHQQLKKVNNQATIQIDKILHHNRSCLLEIVGKRRYTYNTPKLALDQKNFNYTYVTGYHINSKNKIVNHVYDFSYIIFSDQKVQIWRKREQ